MKKVNIKDFNKYNKYFKDYQEFKEIKNHLAYYDFLRANVKDLLEFIKNGTTTKILKPKFYIERKATLKKYIIITNLYF